MAELQTSMIPPYIVKIPVDIYLDELLINYPTNVPNSRDYILFILSKIRFIDEYTQISSVQIQKVVQEYKQLLNWLIDRGILVTDNHYIVRREQNVSKSKGYKFSQQYLNSTKKEVIKYRILLNKISRNNSKTIKPLVQTDIVNIYGFEEPLWFTPRHVGSLLNLKPNKMIQALKELHIVKSENDPTNPWYKCELSKRKRFVYNSLRFSEDGIDIIRVLAEKYPDLFPKKDL